MDQVARDAFNASLSLVLKRAATDAEFRARCLAAPAQAFREAASQDLPAGLVLRFVEPAPGELVLPLPKPDPGRKHGKPAKA